MIGCHLEEMWRFTMIILPVFRTCVSKFRVDMGKVLKTPIMVHEKKILLLYFNMLIKVYH